MGKLGTAFVSCVLAGFDAIGSGGSSDSTSSLAESSDRVSRNSFHLNRRILLKYCRSYLPLFGENFGFFGHFDDVVTGRVVQTAIFEHQLYIGIN